MKTVVYKGTSDVREFSPTDLATLGFGWHEPFRFLKKQPTLVPAELADILTSAYPEEFFLDRDKNLISMPADTLIEDGDPLTDIFVIDGDEEPSGSA